MQKYSPQIKVIIGVLILGVVVTTAVNFISINASPKSDLATSTISNTSKIIVPKTQSAEALIIGTLWSGIIDPSRAIEWSHAGADKIPLRQKNCSELKADSSAEEIQNAIDLCPPGYSVYLEAGTYNLTRGLKLKSDITLRGAGADKTFLEIQGAIDCGFVASICVGDGSSWSESSNVLPGGPNSASWTGGYERGSKKIYLENVGSSGFKVGQYIYLDQDNDLEVKSDFFICDNTESVPPCSQQGGAPGRLVKGRHRSQFQVVKVTMINGNEYSIEPGVYAPNIGKDKSPGAWWPTNFVTNAGIEDLSVDHGKVDATAGIVFVNSYNSWVKGVRSINANRNHVWLTQAAHITVSDNYFYGTKNAGTQSYGVESFLASDVLVQNNIFQKVSTPIMAGPVQGGVFAYNYSVYDFTNVPHWLYPMIVTHDAGVIYNLWEGNIGSGFLADSIHGTTGFNTLYRNYFLGKDTGTTNPFSNTPIQIYSYNRFLNIIGNVLGSQDYHKNYESGEYSIYRIGNGDASSGAVVKDDPKTRDSLLRWGNFDVVTNFSKFSPEEVPVKISFFSNPVPTSKSLPPSLYSKSKPTWWPISKPWPPIGPDITGGNISGTGGHANTIPAEDCYLNKMQGPIDGNGSILDFNASDCY